jgi:hypothetical protein
MQPVNGNGGTNKRTTDKTNTTVKWLNTTRAGGTAGDGTFREVEVA